MKHDKTRLNVYLIYTIVPVIEMYFLQKKIMGNYSDFVLGDEHEF